MKFRRLICALVFSLVALGAVRADDLKLKIIAFNDFHGNLQSPGKYRANAQSPAVEAGGADFLAGYVAHLKSENPNNIVVAAGDLIGASPLVSALFHDEDTIEAMNRLGLQLTSVGNHEFDKGKRELLRMQSGGCSHQDQSTCEGAKTGTPVPFQGAKFEYLAANVFDTSARRTLFPAYALKSYGGVRVAFLGLTLKETPAIVTPSGVAGLRFDDEASTINALVRRLRKRRVESFVVLIHQGGRQTTAGTPDINACEGGLRGTPIENIVHNLDDAVDLVISGHTHQAYICRIANRAGRKIWVTSAASYGRLLTDIDVTIDKKTGDVKDITARNLVVARTGGDGITPDAAIKNIVEKYAALAAPITNRVVGTISADLTKSASPAGESSLGDVIADAQLEATSAGDSGGAVAAFMNDGGIRTDLAFDTNTAGVENGSVTYGNIFSVQPFGNSLVTMSLTGAQIKTMLEQQFEGCPLKSSLVEGAVPATDRRLQVSEGFSYTWNPAGAACEKVDAASIRINGAALSPSSKYRITVNSFLADGGGDIAVLKEGTDRLGGPQDVDALAAYFARHRPVAPVPAHRVSVAP